MSTINRKDFIFTIGYQGEAAIVDSQAKKKYGNLSAPELADKGLFRPAFCAALWDENEEDLQRVVDGYNRQSGSKLNSPEQMKRLLGVFSVPQEVSRIIKI